MWKPSFDETAGWWDTMSTKKPTVLFLCTHNAARSQMAEALLRHHAGDRFAASSAGLEPTQVHPLTRQVLDEMGVDSSGLRAKGAREFLGRARVRYAIVVCEKNEASCPKLFPFSTQTLYWTFDDPTQPAPPELQLSRFRRVRDAIDARLKDWLRSAR
jgi:arsenate reductase (thioredoxin)